MAKPRPSAAEIFGVGFTSEGFDRSSHYFRMPDGADPRAAWILETRVADPLRTGDPFVPVELTRRGKPVAVIVSVNEFRRLYIWAPDRTLRSGLPLARRPRRP